MNLNILFSLILLSLSASAQVWNTPAYREAMSAVPAASGGGGGPLVIQHAWKGVSGAANNVAVTVAPSAGNLLVVCTVNDTATISSISDNIGSTTGWAQAVDYHPTGTHIGCWYKKNIPGGITTITVTATGGAFITAIIHEVSGASTTAPFTTGEFSTQNNSTPTTNPRTAALVNATPNSIMFAWCADFSQVSNPATLTINGAGTVGAYNLFSTSNSQELDASANDITSVPNQIVSASASQIHGWTTPNGIGSAVIIAFH